MRETTITHPHFGSEPVAVYAIRVTPNGLVTGLSPKEDR
jgi:hypothetical protein